MPPPPPQEASGQQLVVKVAGSGSMGAPWAPKASTMHPNTILKPNLDPNTHPSPKPSPDPTPRPNPNPNPPTLIKTEYWDRAGGGGNISYDW